MEHLRRSKWLLALFSMVLVLGFMGCESDDDDDAPEDIGGPWAATFTRAGEAPMNESWTFVQNGQAVTGSYTFDLNTWSFSGTYVNGVFSGMDADQWVLNITFKGNSGSGTIAGDGEVWNASLTR
jgi:hypothetical protein